MTRVGSPGSGLSPASLPQGAPASALLTEVPAALRNAGLGAFLTGTVIERAANGMTMLQTGAGILGIKTTVPLPVGSAVTLQVQTAGAQIQAIVLAVTPQAIKTGVQAPLATLVAGRGASPSQPAAVTPSAIPTAPATTPAPVDARAVAPSAITATVIGPPGSALPPAALAAAAQAPAAPPPVAGASQTAPAPQTASASAALTPQPPPAAPAPGMPVAAQAAAYQRQFNAVPVPAAAGTPPAAAPAAVQAPIPPTVAMPPQADAKTAMAPTRIEAPPIPLPNGTQLQVRLMPTEANPTLPTVPANAAPTAPRPSLLPASLAGLLRLPEAPAQVAAAPAPAVPTMLAATIVARTPAGQTILDTAMGRMLVPLPRTLENAAPGSSILLELLANDLQTTSSRAGTAAPAPSLAREWPALKEMARLFQQAPTQETQAALERAIPKPGPRLAQQMMAFVESATQGGARAWLGDTLSNAIQRLAGGLIERIDHDLREMLSQRAVDSEWRMTVIPMLDGRDFRQIRFFERKRKREEAERKKDDSSRFVVECEHSEFGPVQIDGLMHERRMDVIVRTHDALPADMERDILVLFGESCTGLNLAGQLFFQAVPVFPVNPLDDFSRGGVQVSA
jgi:hypothetical protein